jgi:hypothetical protein
MKFFLGSASLLAAVVYGVRPFPWALSLLPGFSMAMNTPSAARPGFQPGCSRWDRDGTAM